MKILKEIQMQKIIDSRIQDLTYRSPAHTVFVYTHITVDAEYLDLARRGFEYIPQNALEAVREGWTLGETAISMLDLADVAVHLDAQGVDYDNDDTRGVRATRGSRIIPHAVWDVAEMIINNDPRCISGCVAPE
jgi:hypothetical protein